eukprot:tig00020904_g15208.t1
MPPHIVMSPHSESGPVVAGSELAGLVTSDLVKHREHVALDAAAMRRLGLRPGVQVRVAWGVDGQAASSFSLCTVVEAAALADNAMEIDSDANVLVAAPAASKFQKAGVNQAGLARLLSAFSRDPAARLPEPRHVLVTPFSPLPNLSDAEARALGEMTEGVLGNLATARVLVLAPHGGDVEPGTERQAEELVRLLGGDVAAAWVCRGYNRQGSAMGRHHVTSTELSEASFPGLARVAAAAAARRFEFAVSLHGMREAGLTVRVGGGGAERLRRDVAEALRGALQGWAAGRAGGEGARDAGASAGASGASSGDESGAAVPPAGGDGTPAHDPLEVDVQVVGKGHRLSGAADRNVVNRYSAGGVQLEQGGMARAGAGPAVAAAVAGVLSRLLASSEAPPPRQL